MLKTITLLLTGLAMTSFSACAQDRSLRDALKERREAPLPTPATNANALFDGVPELARSSWPIFHANTLATASSASRGPGRVSDAQTVDALGPKRARRPNVSPWTVVAEPYADGSQAVITTPNRGLAKYLIRNDQLEAVGFLDLERDYFDFDWGILLLDNGLGIVTEQKRDRFVIFGDANPREPTSPLEVKGYIPINEPTYGDLNAHFSLAPDGRLIVLTEAEKLIAVDLPSGSIIAEYDLPAEAGVSFHNSFPIDEQGRLYLSTQNLMVAIDWTGARFEPAWSARYDMRGPGCDDIPQEKSRRQEVIAVARGETCTGSGTTPSLIGDQATGIVVIVDGHAPQNNLVAFWRDQPPADWRAIRDPNDRLRSLDRRVAGVLALPYSTPEGRGYTAENSPAVLGNSVIVAQWAGFRPGRRAPKGVQRVDWDDDARRLKLKWASPDIHFNGVPTIACRRQGFDCHAYGMGRYGPEYEYVSLDFETGRETGRVNLGRDDSVLDQGNNHSVAEDGSIVYSGKSKMVRIR